jgi:solute carrier family 25 (mitochondrial carnitine/acylcarnitine transporter), member 20/29
MQTNPQRYSSLFSTFRAIFKEEGLVHGFYRGVASPLVALTILNMMNFTIYAKSTALLDLKDDKEKALTKNTFEPRVFVAGSASGIFASLISTPFEHVKIQMQLANITSNNKTTGSANNANSFRVARSMLSQGSVPLLYRGHCVNTLREICFLGTYFFIYEHSKHVLNPYLPTSISIALSGGVSGAIGWFVSFPLDAIKSNIQGVALTSPRLSAVAIARQLVATKGLLGLYSGVYASVARAFLVSSSRFTAYELTQHMLRVDK